MLSYPLNINLIMKYKLLSILILATLYCFADDPPEQYHPDGSIGGYEYVDLGLPSGTLWATYNIGATSPYEYGDLFAWGEVEPREYFTWDNYPFVTGTTYDPNNGSWYNLVDIGEDICGTEYDAARHIWGNGWRLPNQQDCREFRMHTWGRWTEENGVKGLRVYGPSENSIFLPAGGVAAYDWPLMTGIYGYFWTGVQDKTQGYNGRPIEPSNHARAIWVEHYNDQLTFGNRVPKFNGCSIRPVFNPRTDGIADIANDEQLIETVFTNGYIRVNGHNLPALTLSVNDLSGRTVFSGTIENGGCQLPHISTGIYIVSLFDGKTLIKTQKIIIKY